MDAQELINHYKAGERDFTWVDLNGADLSGADLNGADLSGADLSDANLLGANLRGADLRRANIGDANLIGADLTGADLTGTDLTGADLTGADLQGANLNGTDLWCANLIGAENIPYEVIELTNICPDGEFIGYKKLQENRIAKLLIPAIANRSNATTRKIRVSEAKVLEIFNDRGESFDHGFSLWNPDFIYKVGEIVTPDRWHDNRWNECANGIHCFLTLEEAKVFVL